MSNYCYAQTPARESLLLLRETLQLLEGHQPFSVRGRDSVCECDDYKCQVLHEIVYRLDKRQSHNASDTELFRKLLDKFKQPATRSSSDRTTYNADPDLSSSPIHIYNLITAGSTLDPEYGTTGSCTESVLRSKNATVYDQSERSTLYSDVGTGERSGIRTQTAEECVDDGVIDTDVDVAFSNHLPDHRSRSPCRLEQLHVHDQTCLSSEDSHSRGDLGSIFLDDSQSYHGTGDLRAYHGTGESLMFDSTTGSIANYNEIVTNIHQQWPSSKYGWAKDKFSKCGFTPFVYSRSSVPCYSNNYSTVNSGSVGFGCSILWSGRFGGQLTPRPPLR